MKKIITLLSVLLITAFTFGQAPEKMSYQAVLRDANNVLVVNQQVGMRISILNGANAVYSETQSPTTNSNGLISLEIGTGSVISGTFKDINWGDGIYYIKTEIDPSGKENYSISGTTQLLSVPYALYAEKSGSREINLPNIITTLTEGSNDLVTGGGIYDALKPFVGGESKVNLTFTFGGISAINGAEVSTTASRRTDFISINNAVSLKYYGMRSFEGSGFSLLALYDENKAFIGNIEIGNTNGSIRSGLVDFFKDYKIVKFFRLSCNSNPGFIAEITATLTSASPITLNAQNISENTNNIASITEDISNLKSNKVIQKKNFYTEKLLDLSNITTNNAQTLTTFYPSIVDNNFDYSIFSPSVIMKQATGNFPNQYYAIQDVPRKLGFTIDFKFTGRYIEIAGREGYYSFSLVVNDKIIVKNFKSSTGNAGFDSLGRTWSKVDLGETLINAHVRLYMYNVWAGIATDGTISKYKTDRLKLIVDGDSIIEGTGVSIADTNLLSWAGVLSTRLDFDMYNAAVGGSGFVNLGNNNEPNMVNRFSTYISPYDCDIFICAGGLNDGYLTYPSNVNTAVIDYFTLLNNRYRNTTTKVIIVSPYEPHPDTKSTHLGILAIRDKQRELSAKYGFAFIDIIDGITYDEMGNTIQDSSQTIGGMLDNGRKATFYFDGTHPNALGHKYIGDRIVMEVIRLLK